MHARLIGVGGEPAVDALLDKSRLGLILVTRRQQARYASAKFSMAPNGLRAGLIGFERLPPAPHVVRCMIEWQQPRLGVDRYTADGLGRSIDRFTQIGIAGFEEPRRIALEIEQVPFVGVACIGGKRRD